MKKALILAMVAALCAGPLTPVGAKKAPKELTFYLHFPAEGQTCGASYMDLKADTPDSGCGYRYQPANEVFHATGAQPVLTRDWPASEGFPFKLDANRPVTAQLALMNLLGSPAVGQAVVELTVVGTANGRSATLVEESVTITMAPGTAGSNIAEFEVKLPKSLAGKKFKSLTATTMVRGANNFHYFDLEGDTMARIVIPTK